MYDLTINLWLEAITAFGTLAAVIVSVAVGARSERRAHRAEEALQEDRKRRGASVVAAWIEQRYEALPDGSGYLRLTEAFIANSGTEPVFHAVPSVHLAHSDTSLGSLSRPQVIPVLAPGVQLTFDLTTPLLVHAHPHDDQSNDVLMELAFTDPGEIRWRREKQGRLVQVDTSSARSLMARSTPERQEKQIGQVEDPYSSPMAVALLFSAALTAEPEIDEETLDLVLAPEAPRWVELARDEWLSLRSDLSVGGLGGHVEYPTPQIAYIKHVREDQVDLEIPVGGGVYVEVSFITLIFTQERGWRVFGYGPRFNPAAISFAAGSVG